MFDDFVEFQTMLNTPICVKRYDILAIEDNQGRAILVTTRMNIHINHSYNEAIAIAGIKVKNGNQDQ